MVHSSKLKFVTTGIVGVLIGYSALATNLTRQEFPVNFSQNRPALATLKRGAEHIIANQIRAEDWQRHNSKQGFCTYVGSLKGVADMMTETLVSLTGESTRILYPAGRSFQWMFGPIVGAIRLTIKDTASACSLSVNNVSNLVGVAGEMAMYCASDVMDPTDGMPSRRGEGTPSGSGYDGFSSLRSNADGIARAIITQVDAMSQCLDRSNQGTSSAQ